MMRKALFVLFLLPLLWSPVVEAADADDAAPAEAAAAGAEEARLGEVGSEPLRLLRVTPEGEDVHAFSVGQLVFEFSRPMVPLGRMEREAEEIPITVTPALDCQWRWVDRSTLACQLEGPGAIQENDRLVRHATAYEIEIRPGPGLSTEEGLTLEEPVLHRFVTRRPAHWNDNIINWLSPGRPLIEVNFNQPVTKASVERTMRFWENYRREGPDDTVLWDDEVPVLVFPEYTPGRLPVYYESTPVEELPQAADPVIMADGDEARHTWVLEPARELSLDTGISLGYWEGLQSSEGPEPGESNWVTTFHTFPAFRFIGIQCTRYAAPRPVTIPLTELQSVVAATADPATRGCSPQRQINLLFSSPVLDFTVRDHAEITPALDGGRDGYDPWANHRNYSDRNSENRPGAVYSVSLPRPQQPNRHYQVELPAAITDEFGRRLNTPGNAPLSFSFPVSQLEPGIHRSHRSAVLEKEQDSEVPLYVTNLNSISIVYDRVTAAETATDISRNRPLTSDREATFSIPMDVRGLLGDESGMVYAELYPRPKPPRWSDEQSSISVLAQVTPYQVHYKLGHFNSLVWVTDFAEGEPVDGATVTLHRGNYQDLPALQEIEDIRARTDGDGMAELPGLAQLDPSLWLSRGGYNAANPGLFLKAEKDGDIAIIPLSYDYRVNSRYPNYPRLRTPGGHSHAWGSTAQGIYKLGDEVQFKIYVRDQSNRHWVPSGYSRFSLQVLDPQNKVMHEDEDVRLNEFGAFHGAFKLPRQGAVGRYRFRLTAEATEDLRQQRWHPMTVLVSDFTPAPFSVSNGLNGGGFKPGDEVRVTSTASLFAGGPYPGAEVRITARLQTRPFRSAHPALQGFRFSSRDDPDIFYGDTNLLDVRGLLDQQGEHEETFTLPQRSIYYGRMQVETAVRDERGALITDSTQADYVGRSLFAGLRNTRWLYQRGEAAAVEAVAVDEAGNPVAGQNITVTVSRRQTRAARVRGAGNAYRTQNSSEWVEESRCGLISGAGPVPCGFAPQQPGRYQFTASVTDGEGREHQVTIGGWAVGSGTVVWDQDDNALTLIPERNDYKVGDTARYLVQNPYPGAKALVTVERYGILDSWVETLDTATPVIEVPIEEDYLPGFYLSVVVMSPRLEAPIEGGVDLGKPTYRMGYLRVRVSDPYKELAVAVTTDQALYRPRDTVTADIQVAPGQGRGGGPYEIAVAVVDESVLALNRAGDSYYDPYRGFNRLDGLDLLNFSLLSRLVGRQNFERKGANPGGGGLSHTALRNLFKYVAYWNPSLQTDSRGRAQVEFTVPDNLTGWRVLALAVTPEDRMGLGSGTFKVNRDTEIRPVMPNLLSVGDRVRTGFSVLNRTGEARQISIEVRVESSAMAEMSRAARRQLCEPYERESGLAVIPCETVTHETPRLNLLPYQRENVWIEFEAAAPGNIRFIAVAGDDTDRDAIEHTIEVKRRETLSQVASHGALASLTASDTVTEEQSLLIPQPIYANAGGVGVTLSPTVLGSLDGSFRYMRDYPYACWEQRISKAVGAAAYLSLADFTADDMQWPNAGASVQQEALERAVDFQAPNGGMAYWRPGNRYVSAYLSAYTAVAFNQLREAGYTIPAGVEESLHGYLLGILRRDEFPSFYSRAMTSSVRALALVALAEHGKIDPSDIERYAPYTEEMSLFGKAQFLQAAAMTEGSDSAVIEDTLRQIMNHANQSGGRIQFTESMDSSFSRILSSPARSECSILSALLATLAEDETGGITSYINDAPLELARAVVQGRGGRPHWRNTQENVFCLSALMDYAADYEAEDPDMEVRVTFADRPSDLWPDTRPPQVLGSTRFRARNADPVTFSRPMNSGDPGRAAAVQIDKTGEGTLYYSTRLAYQPLEENASRVNAGFEIRREYSVERDDKFVIIQSPMQIQRGDLVRVDLFITAPAARYFAVVDDPVPSGLEPLNSDLATASEADAAKGTAPPPLGSRYHLFNDWVGFDDGYRGFYHREMRHEAARFYSDYLPPGRYHLSYLAQAIAEGEFAVPPARGEEMYNPVIYGLSLPAKLTVGDDF